MTTTDTLENTQTHAFAAETSRVLNLMIHALYTNRDIFLRELISNASDACDKLRFEALTNDALMGDAPDLSIYLSFDEKARTVTITDTGIGMNREDLIANLGTIAKSGTGEFLAAMEATGTSSPIRGEDGRGVDANGNVSVSPHKHSSSRPHPNPPPMGEGVNLIGQFGVGFYSAFMVADRVRVLSRKAGEQAAWLWESDGLGSYTIRACHPERSEGSQADSSAGPQNDSVARGTSVTLHLKDDASEYLDRHKLGHIVSTYSDHIRFPITLTDGEGVTHSLNAGTAIWARPKSEISDEHYQEFYRHVAHSPEKPWAVLHTKAEGTLEYTSLLFIPGIKPFDLFHPERRRRVKLYVKRVFITDEQVELVPAYLRFLRGVVDSADLPLNISREVLQASPMLEKIRDAVTSRVLSELKKRAEKESERYARFWEHFGAVLKEGLCEATAPREKILEVCRFASTHDAAALTSLDDYIARMSENQQAIYYMTGDTVAALTHSPQLEGFTKRGIEVLLLADHVDDFWTTSTTSYKGKPLRSVMKAGADLGAFALDATDEQKEQEAASSDAVHGLMEAMRTLYGDAVRTVCTTRKLTHTPMCLSVGEGDMDLRMERFLAEHKQLPKRAAKTVEINPTHPVIMALADKLAAAAAADVSAASAEINDTLWLLFDQALIAEGEPVMDAAAFARRLGALMQQGLHHTK